MYTAGMREIPGEEASGAIGLLDDGINVPVELKFTVQGYTEVWNWIDNLKLVSMNVVRGWDGVMLVCYLQFLTLRGIEAH